MELTTRELTVLRKVVDLYIRTGKHVASAQLARSPGLSLSPASLRNVMAGLEQAGYLTRSHSSAGCVPTDIGYRRYVDSLPVRRRVSPVIRRRMIEQMRSMRRDLVEDIGWVAEVAAETIGGAGMAMRPMDPGPVLEAVSLVDLGSDKVLGLVVTSDGAVDKRVIRRSPDSSAGDLHEETNFLNHRLRGMTIDQIRNEVWDDQRSGDADEDDESLCGRSFALARQLFDNGDEDVEISLAGAASLLQRDEFAEADRVRSLFSTLQDEKRLVREWRRAFDGGRTRVLIGEESEVTAAGHLGMVATLFFRGGRRAGAVGVVGPRRMDYGRIVPLVEFMGDALTRMLDEPGTVHA